MVNAIELIQGPDSFALNYLLADETLMAKELVIVELAIGQALSFIMPLAQKGPLASGANEVINMEVLPQGRYDSLLDGPPTGPTDWYAHFVVTLDTV